MNGSVVDTSIREEMAFALSRYVRSAPHSEKMRIYRAAAEQVLIKRMNEYMDDTLYDLIGERKAVFIERTAERLDRVTTKVLAIYDQSILNQGDSFRKGVARLNVIACMRMIYDSLPGAMKNEIAQLLQVVTELDGLGG